MSTAAAEPLTSASPADSLGNPGADRDQAPASPESAPLGRRWFAGTVVAAFLLSFLQAPGHTVADTKYDLAQNPLGFLDRASHLWSSQAPMGQVQNQAYGYFFPHGTFFSLGDLLGLPAWVTQRIWWALLLLAGFWGIIRLCETLGIGSRGSRVVAAVAFTLSPRVLTTLGSISSETLPMVLAPWVLIAPAALGNAYRERRRGGADSPAGSALALALMGAVNAVATVAAFLPALLWWASYRPNRRWWRFTLAWVPLLLLATLWWVVPLLLLGKVSPPFLDYIESSGVTTQWASLAEVLRGTDSWTPFVSPERIAGAVLVTQPAAVLATGLIAAAGMAGLAMRSMPHRGRLSLILIVGLVGICAGFVGELSGPFAESVRLFLDSTGAPLRNVHKLEPLIRIPLVLGLAHLIARVPLPVSVSWRQSLAAFARPERDRLVAVTALILTALVLSTSLAWTGKLAPRGAYEAVPGYWHDTADWLAENAADTRALIVPGAPFGSQVWGLTRDEPLQALASTPWAVRDSVPLNPPGTIRAMDSVQRLIADGRPSTGLAATLADQGIGVLVLRNDLDPETSRSTRPMLAHQAIEGSPGLTKVAGFGGPIESSVIAEDLVVDGDLRPTYPAIEIYRVEAPRAPGIEDTTVLSGTGAPESFPGAYTVPLASVPVVQGGPEVLERRNRGEGVTGPSLLAADAERAGLPVGPVTVTDTPMDREADFGRVDNHNSALRAPGDERRTHNLVPDYPVEGAGLVQGAWSGATLTASSSAADATQLGGAAPGSSTAAAVDGDPSTAWISNGTEIAVGQWLRLDFDEPVSNGLLRLTTSGAAIGDPVKWVEARTENGSVSTRIPGPGKPVALSLPPGRTEWLIITALRTERGSAGGQFGISELAVDDYADRDNPRTVDIRHHTVLPPTPGDGQVLGWDLGQEFPGRSACFDGPDRVRCSKSMTLAPEEPGTFARTLAVPEPMTLAPELTVRTRQGPALEALLTDQDRPAARGRADVGDLRGSAFAATDGDPRTAWIAPEDSVRTFAAGKPTLTVELPEPALVTGLDLTTSLGTLPAEPTAVTVNLGKGPQVRTLDTDREPGTPTRVDLHPAVTDRIEISIHSWKTVLDRTALGFAQTQPPGLAEIEVLGPQYPAPAAPDRLLTVACEAGPTVALAGRTVQTTVTATAHELLSGAPVTATVCAEDGGEAADPGAGDAAPGAGGSDTDGTGTDESGRDESDVDGPDSADPGTTDSTADESGDTTPGVGGIDANEPGSGDSDVAEWGASQPEGEAAQEFTVLPGQPEVVVSPTEMFSVDRLQLTRTDVDLGLIELARAETVSDDKLLVLPLSTNVGWQAHTADGRELEPVVVDGWQQAWLLPADAAGPITVSFPVDRWYRLGIFGGLLLLIPLLALAIPRRARVQERADPAPRPWSYRVLAAIGVLAAATVIAGAVGAALTIAGLLATRLHPARTSVMLAGVAGIFTAVSAAALSTGPWRSPEGYLGGSLWVQLPALAAVVAVGLAALPPRRG